MVSRQCQIKAAERPRCRLYDPVATAGLAAGLVVVVGEAGVVVAGVETPNKLANNWRSGPRAAGWTAASGDVVAGAWVGTGCTIREENSDVNNAASGSVVDAEAGAAELPGAAGVVDGVVVAGDVAGVLEPVKEFQTLCRITVRTGIPIVVIKLMTVGVMTSFSSAGKVHQCPWHLPWPRSKREPTPAHRQQDQQPAAKQAPARATEPASGHAE